MRVPAIFLIEFFKKLRYKIFALFSKFTVVVNHILVARYRRVDLVVFKGYIIYKFSYNFLS